MYGNAQIRAAAARSIRSTEMNHDRIQGMCTQLRGRIKQSWGVLVDDPHCTAEGARERLDGRIREQRGIAKQEAERQLREFMSRNRRWWDLSRQ